jgi:hypothetical protein
MGVYMKKLFLVFGFFIGSLFCSVNQATAKNDTVIINYSKECRRFSVHFTHVFSNLVKDDMRKMMEADPEKFKVISGEIKSLVINKRTCDANSIIPILKQHGSLRHIVRSPYFSTTQK